MVYINSKGQVAAPSYAHQITTILTNLYLGFLLFISTLFHPKSSSNLKPNNSISSRDYGGGNGRGGGGGRGDMKSVNRPVVGASQSCCGATY